MLAVGQKEDFPKQANTRTQGKVSRQIAKTGKPECLAGKNQRTRNRLKQTFLIPPGDQSDQTHTVFSQHLRDSAYKEAQCPGRQADTEDRQMEITGHKK